MKLLLYKFNVLFYSQVPIYLFPVILLYFLLFLPPSSQILIFHGKYTYKNILLYVYFHMSSNIVENLVFTNVGGLIIMEPQLSSYVPTPVVPISIVTDSLIINLDSTLGINGATWTDQTGNGYNYTFYNSTTNIGGSNTGTNITTATINGFQSVLLNGATNFLWRSNPNGFGSYFLNSFTYEMWVFPLSVKNATLIYENGQNSFSGWADDQMGINSTGYITSYVYEFGGPIGNSVSTSSYNSNNWYQIVNVYDNTAKIFYQYVNGVLSTQVSVTKQYPTSGKVWLILGSNASNVGNFMGVGYFNGYIGAFRGYNIALSPSQILQNYNAYLSTRYYTNVPAQGGTISQYNNYTLHTFTNSGTFTVKSPIQVKILIVGGGGAGDSYVSNWEGHGGGGAGGVGYGTLTLPIGSYSVTVGNGGISKTANTNGGNSSFISITSGISISEIAYGGSSGSTGGTGSTGGGSKSTASSSKNAGSGTITYLANIGGNSSVTTSIGGGGGGGANSNGNSNSGYNGGSGGSGFTWSDVNNNII